MTRPGYAVGALLLVCAAVGCSSSRSSSPAADDDAGTGSSGLPLCKSSGKNAFETYQSAGFVAVNEAIFANVTAETTKNGTKNLGTSFGEIGKDGHDPLDTFEGTLAAFLVFAYGGPSSITYTDGKKYSGGVDMQAVHKGFKITADQYNYFVTDIIVPALTSSGVTADDVSSCFAPVISGTTGAGFMASIVGQ